MEGAQGLCTAIEKLLKEADDVISSRSRDLRSAISLLHNDAVNHTPTTLAQLSHLWFGQPLTTPPAPFLGLNPLAQVTDKGDPNSTYPYPIPIANWAYAVDEVVAAQERVLNDLENTRDDLETTVYRLSDRRESLVRLTVNYPLPR